MGRYQCTVKMFGWIILKVIYKGQIWLIFHLEAIFSKTVWSLFLYFGMKLPKEGANGLPKDGFIESL